MKTNIDMGLVEHGNLQFIETIKLLVYKLDEGIFDELDSDQGRIYLPNIGWLLNTEKKCE